MWLCIIMAGFLRLNVNMNDFIHATRSGPVGVQEVDDFLYTNDTARFDRVRLQLLVYIIQ